MKALKKTVSLLLIIMLILSTIISLSANQDEKNPQLEGLTAQQYILIDGNSGQILYQKGMNERIHPASTTKILTALMIFNSGINLDTVVTVSEAAVSDLPSKATHIALVKDEKLTVEELLYGLLLPSGNDCANVLAELYIDHQTADPTSLTFSQKIELFGQQMTEYAKTLGCLNSNFVNPHGLFDENHYSTPYDMSKILLEASKNIRLQTILMTIKHTIPATNKTEARTYILTTNKMINNYTDYYYQYCTGGKTGYTELSGYGFISIAEKNDQKLICALYNCSDENDGDDRFNDAKILFEYGFNNFQKITLSSQEMPREMQQISDGSKIIATALIYSQNDMEIDILNTMTKDDVEIIDNTPEIIDQENPIASFTIKLNNTDDLMYSDAGTYPLMIKIERLDNPIIIDPPESTESPTQQEKPTENAPGQNDHSNTGVIIIIIVFTILLIAILILVSLYVVSNKKRQSKAKDRFQDRTTRSKDISSPNTEGKRLKENSSSDDYYDNYPAGKRFKK